MKKMVEKLKSEDKNPVEDERHKLEKFIKQKERQNNILKKILTQLNKQNEDLEIQTKKMKT